MSRLRTLGQVAWHFPLMSFLRVDNYRNLLINLQRWGEGSVVCPLATRGCFCPITAAQQDRKWPRLPDYFAIGRTTDWRYIP